MSRLRNKDLSSRQWFRLILASFWRSEDPLENPFGKSMTYICMIESPRIILRLAVFFLLALSLCASAAGQSLRPVTIPGSEVRTLRSTATGRDYDLYIHAPHLEPGRKYPVLYVLDGQWDFKLLDSVYGGLLYDKFVPEMFIVGITYSGANPNYDSLRAMDLTPVAVPLRPGSGDAPKFLSFLEQQLLPYIEQTYPADPSRRILMGSSLGGLFTLYTMFTEPALFSAYVSASPAVTYGAPFAFKQEADFAAHHHELPTRLFLSVGAIEELAGPVQDYAKILRSRSYQGLKLETRVIEGERHSGVKPESFNRGLRFVFQN